MKKLVLFFVIFFMSFAVNAQISIVEPSDLTTDLNNTTIDKSGNPSDFEIVKYLWLINNGTENLSLKCKKIEVDVLAGTENVTCWKICPMAYDVAGVNPSAFISVGGVQMIEDFDPSGSASGNDTVRSFSGHYKPMNLDGCSLMRYEFYNVNDLNTAIASINIRFIHSSGPCTVSDNSIHDLIEFKLFPNPASDVLVIQLDGLHNNQSNLTYSVVDVIGKTVIKGQLNTLSNRSSEMDVSDLNQGVYLVSLSDGQNTLQTQRLIIKH
ncbi:MAG: T9SS type A sorting domain-containing protein [Bacteroidota bacterium]|nr:T9SS type A sorting domain-containing protein [Bacteroidota bacterium]